MRTLFVAGVAGTAFIAPALAAALAPKEIQAIFFITADGKITREPAGQGRDQRRGHVETFQGRFLHHLER